MKLLVLLITLHFTFYTEYCLYAQDTSKIEMDLDYYMDMHKKNPEAVEYILKLADYYKEKKMFIESLNWFKKAESLQPQNADVLFRLGLLLSWTGDYNGAINYFDRILAVAPGYDDAKLAKARVLIWQDKRGEALILCDDVIKNNPKYAEAYEIKARIFMWNKDYISASNIYSKILELEPGNKNARISLIDVTAVQGDYGNAVSQYKKMLEEYPDDTAVLNGLGKVLNWKGDYDGAVSYFEKSLKVNPENSETAKALAQTYRWAGRYKEGLAMQKEILERDKNNLSAVMETALLYEMQGEYKQAIEWYEKAEELGADKSQIDARLGLLRSYADRIDESITAQQKALTVKDNDVENLITLGRVYGWELRIAESIKLYKDALRIDPSNQEAYIGLGKTYFYDGNWQEAGRQFKKVLEINPLNKEASAELEKLEQLTKPGFETRVDYLKLKNYDPPLSGFAEQTIRREYSQSVDMSFSSIFSGSFRYKRIIEKELENTDKNYGLTGDEYSVLLSRRFGKRLKLTGKLIAGFYRDDGSEVYVLRNKETGCSGFVFARYDLNRWMFTANYGSEPAYPIFRGSDLKIKYLENTGLSVRRDMTENISFILSAFYKDYYNIFNRKDYIAGVEYIPLFLKQCELGYYYRHLTAPAEDIGTLKTSYKNRFEKINYSVAYMLESDVLYDTDNHSVNLFAYRNITDAVGLYTDISYGFERGDDRDESFHSKVYTAYQF